MRDNHAKEDKDLPASPLGGRTVGLLFEAVRAGLVDSNYWAEYWEQSQLAVNERPTRRTSPR